MSGERRDHEPPDDADPRTAVRALLSVGRIYARDFHRLDVLQPSMLPRTGPAILVSNHTSSLDPVLIQSAVSRPVVWMMAREYYEIRAMRWGFRLIDAIPVDRSGRDLAATRAALRALRAGRIVGMFPEGRIERTRDLLPFEPGVAMLAYHGKADVYPAYLDGSQRGADMLTACVHPQHAILTFGPKVSLHFGPEKHDFVAATEAIKVSVEALKPVASSLQERAKI